MDRQVSRGAVEAAAIVLGIEESIDTVTIETVKTAYRNALRKVHPDSSAIEITDAANQLHIARTAKDLLIDWIKSRPDPQCRHCGGSGFVRSIGFSSRPCPRCT